MGSIIRYTEGTKIPPNKRKFEGRWYRYNISVTEKPSKKRHKAMLKEAQKKGFKFRVVKTKDTTWRGKGYDYHLYTLKSKGKKSRKPKKKKTLRR